MQNLCRINKSLLTFQGCFVTLLQIGKVTYYCQRLSLTFVQLIGLLKFRMTSHRLSKLRSCSSRMRNQKGVHYLRVQLSSNSEFVGLNPHAKGRTAESLRRRWGNGGVGANDYKVSTKELVFLSQRP